MAKTSYRTWVAGELITAAMLNQQIRDNGNEIWKGTTAGDLDYYTSSTSKARLGIGTNGQYLRVVSGVPSWSTFALVANRKGGSSTNWSTAGTTTQDVTTGVQIQCGSASLTFTSDISANTTVTFPTAFSAAPIAFANVGNASIQSANSVCVSTTPTSITLTVSFNETHSFTISVFWMAIGPV
jgi:hypothetical protein